MLTYHYTARDPATGKHIKAEVQAEDEMAAAKLIHEQGFIPIDIALSSKGLDNFTGFLRRVRTKDKVLFSRQLATLINAGLPILQSLRNVERQTSSKQLKVVLNQVIADVEGGMALSVALAKHPQVFNKVYISLIAAGETSGTLDKALERLAVQQEKDAELMSKIRGALAYPAIVILVMIAVVGFMLVKVLPQVQVFYKSLPNAHLPLVTVILLDVSHAIINYWWIFLILVIIAAIFGGRWGRSVAGKRFFDKVKMKAPPFGPLFMKVYMARFARTGSTLVASGIPIIQMLQVTGDAVNNVHIEDSINKAIEKVKGGKSLSEALEGDPNFLELVPNMLKIGEESGSLEEMLSKVADYYEKEVDNDIKNISSLIEPILMVILGIVAFIIVAAILLPIYGLANQGLGSTPGSL